MTANAVGVPKFVGSISIRRRLVGLSFAGRTTTIAVPIDAGEKSVINRQRCARNLRTMGQYKLSGRAFRLPQSHDSVCRRHCQSVRVTKPTGELHPNGEFDWLDDKVAGLSVKD